MTYAASCRGWAPPTPVPLAVALTTLRRLAASGDATALSEALDRSMVSIPSGEFIMGSDSGRNDERPAHRVYLDAFELDRYEVTNAQYRRFLLAAGRRPPHDWPDSIYPTGQDAYPVVGVNWDDADAYCRGQANGCRQRPNGKRLTAARAVGPIPGARRGA
jgi:formylglycine-generating enzyme required for sulfatase activity